MSNQEKIKRNTGKAPAFQFYPNDWGRALEEHPLEIEGAWIRIVCKLWYAENKGTLTKTLEQWSRILRESLEKTFQLLQYIQKENIGNVSFSDNVTFSNVECNGNVTVSCRRMVKDAKLREQNRMRQKRFRGKKEDNEEVTDEVTPSSQPSCIFR